MTKDFIDIIKSRGFLHQMTDEDGLRTLLKTHGQKAYIGFDCTAKSLHVGSLLQIMLLRWWQTCGHTPIVLLGGGTTKIGDPSGKDESRPKLDDAAIAENMASLKNVFAKFIDFDGDKALMVNNDDWLKDLNYVNFLRDYGRHFSVNRMLTMDSVKLRLEREQPLSFLEFNYMIFQAYDFVELNKRYNCRLQMGGEDQWGNILQGIDLGTSLKALDKSSWKKARTKLSAKDIKKTSIQSEVYKNNAGIRIFSAGTVSQEVDGQYEVEYNFVDNNFGIISPLLTTSSGAKMGKTAAGAVWLNADLLKPYDYWQFWRNTEDGDVIRFLKLFTEIELSQIAEYESWVGSAKINDAKIILATEATAMLHGRDEAERASKTAAETFAGRGVSDDLPTIEILNAEIEAGAGLTRWIVKANFASSGSDARRQIENNGISVNDTKITDPNYRLTSADFAQGFAKLSKGKKQHVLVKVK